MTSIIKVDNIQDQCGSATLTKCGTTLTIGASGDTIALAAGASQTGFGASGAVSWDTTPKTSSPVTAVSGNGYFINTTSGAITVNLPATPSAGDIVAIADYANTSATNNIIVGRNGSLINGEAIDATIKVNGQVYTLVYVDATEGWKTVGQTVNQISTAAFVSATGGTITTSGDYKIHTFTGPGTFCVSCAGNPAGSTTVDYMVVAGGGGGAADRGGGGGAGGYRESSGAASGCYSASPLGSGISALPVSAQGYPIIIGGGGTAGTTGAPQDGGNGVNSVFSTVTSTGGGFGSGSPPFSGGPGGSGGGARDDAASGGTGNTPPVAPPQGNPGGPSSSNGNTTAGGGGGATAAGQQGNGNPTPSLQGDGGAGGTTSISGSPTSYAGGGGGGAGPGSNPSVGGAGGGGAGAILSGANSVAGNPGQGGGGGGGSGNPAPNGNGAAGGSGIVIIRYKYQ